MSILISYARKHLSPKQKQVIANILRGTLAAVPHRHNLNLLAMKHGTTKWGNGYMDYYATHFGPLRRKKLNLLEIGVGGYQDPSSGGESLRLWQEYFPNAMIYGIDVIDKSYHDAKRIKTFVGSQDDPQFLKQLTQSIGQVDIVIDDGSHHSQHIITAFNTLFPLLPDGAIYVIEDLNWSYWPQNGGNWQDHFAAGTSMAMLKRIADGLNHQFIPRWEATEQDQQIKELHLYPQIAFIVKGNNVKQLPKYILDEVEQAGQIA